MAKDILLGGKDFMYEETETGFSFFHRLDENMHKGVFLKSPLSDHDSFIMGLREYFKDHKNINLSDLQAAYEKMPREDAWIKTGDKQYEKEPDETLKHTFGNTTVEFGIRYPLNKENPVNILILRDISNGEPNGTKVQLHVKGNVDTAETLVDNTVKHFDQKQDISMLDIASCLQSRNLEAELKNPQGLTAQLAKKAGYIQGVCECVAALGDDHTLGKKLLSEMNVTKDMAKKFASPETYKTLKQGIFAPQQKLEQTRSIKL